MDVAADIAFMGIALEQARLAVQRGDPGFGAVLVAEGGVIAAVGSTEVTGADPTAHDGLGAVRAACAKLGPSALRQCSYYGTAEPCLMCSAALLQARIPRIVLGATGELLAEKLGPRRLLIEDLAADYGYLPMIRRGVLAAEALRVLASHLHPPAGGGRTAT